jgi:hypothetical protein
MAEITNTPTSLSKEAIHATIVSEEYFRFPGTTVTVCLLSLRNGAKMLGYNYGPIDNTKVDWVRGRVESKAMAVDRIWELEGYLLREKLSTQQTKPATRLTLV